MIELEKARDWLRYTMFHAIDEDVRLYCRLLLELTADKGEAE